MKCRKCDSTFHSEKDSDGSAPKKVRVVNDDGSEQEEDDASGVKLTGSPSSSGYLASS